PLRPRDLRPWRHGRAAGCRHRPRQRGGEPVTRLVPHPLLSVALTLVWMFLTAFSLGHLILGSAIALVAGKLFAAFEPHPVPMRRVWKLIPLMGVIALDILRSNIAVAR